MEKQYYCKAILWFSKTSRWSLLMFVLLFSNSFLHAQGNDFEIVAERVIKYNKDMASTQSIDNGVGALISLYTTGTYNLGSNYNNRTVTGAYFSDIDYTSRAAASWPVITHVSRIQTMADAYTRTDSKHYKSTELFDKIEKLLFFWHEANVTSTNWWQQSIGVPKAMTVALLYMEYDGEQKLNEALVRDVLHRIRTTSRTNPVNEAGPNKTDMALHWTNRALIRQNSDTLSLAAKYAFDPMVEVAPSKEGIQYDGSYFQHGSQLQIASYGGELMKTTVAFLEFFHGTQFEITPERLDVFSKFARETYFGTMRGQYFPYMLAGRGVTRSGYTMRTGNAALARSLMSTDPTHKDEYELIARKLENTAHASEGITPISKLYYIGDYISHNRPGYQYSIRTTSSRTYRSEWGNDEGYETYFMSDASNAILQDGNEYGNIYGVWDWAKVPGVTNPLLPRGHIPNSQSSMAAGTSTPGTQQFVGGVTNSLYSSYAYTQYDSWATNNREGKHVSINTIADKAWFMFDDEVVCLGSSLTSNATHADLGDLELITTVNQALLKGNVLVGTKSGQVEQHALGVNKEYDNNVQWVIHNNIGYVFPQGGQVRLETATKSGAWSETNYSESSNIVSEDLFALWLSHGKKSKNEKYAYFVVPNVSDAVSMQEYYENKLKDIEIIENNDAIQAVRHKGLGIWQIVFRKPATFKHDELILKANQASAVMIKDIDTGSGKASVYVGDVMQYGNILKFGIDIPSMTDGLKAITVDNTTAGVHKGRTVEVLFDKGASDYVFEQPETPENEPLFEYSSKATADTYANEVTGTKDTNYGSGTSMTTKYDTAVGWSRQAFIKVPLNDLDKIDDLNNYDLKVGIKLYLLRTNSGAASSTWVLKPVTGDWDENTVTWNNKPAFEEEILGSTPGFSYNGMLGDEFNSDNVINIDISSYAIEQYKSGKKELSLLIHNGIAGGKVDADFATKEHSNESFHPRIIVKGFEKSTIADSKVSKVLADAYVKNGGGQYIRYGEDADMYVNTGGAGYHREVYLTFPLEELKNIDLNKFDVNVYMSLYQYDSQAEANKANWDVRPVADTEWSESKTNGINWSNRPAVTDIIIASLPGFVNNKDISGFNEKNVAKFDITKYALEQLAESKEKISLNIKGNLSAGNSSKYVSMFAPKEYKLDGVSVEERTIPKLTIDLYKKIIKPTVTISVFAVKDKGYDGSILAELDLESIALVGIEAGDDVQVDASDIVLRFLDASQGQNKPVIANGVFKLVGADANKYQLKQPSLNGLTANIVSKPALTISAFAIKDKRYDGSLFAEIDLESIVLAGVEEGDNVQIDASDITFKFQDASPGKDKPIVVTGVFKLKGTNADKYQLTQPSFIGLTANILEEVAIYIDNEEIDIVDGKAYYLVERDNTNSQLDIDIQGVSSGTPNSIDISKPCLQDIKFNEDGVDYTLTIEKRFNFEDLVSVRWNNTLTVKNTPEVHGFEFTAYQWFENNRPISGATRQSYSAGRNGERLNENSLYHVEVTDKSTSKVLRSWDVKVKLTSAMITAYPNPVKTNQTLTVSANLKDEQLKGAKILIHKVNGAYIGSYDIDGDVTKITMPTVAGTYTVSLQNNNGILKSFTIIVN